MARGSEGQEGVADTEAYNAHTVNISQWQYFVARCLSSCISSVFALPSSDVGERHPHTIISLDTVTMEAEAGPSSVVKQKRGKPLKSAHRVFVLNILKN
jgi:hypothetical protein